MEMDEHGFLEDLFGLRREKCEGFPEDMSELLTCGGSYDFYPNNPAVFSPYSSSLEGLANSSQTGFDCPLSEVCYPPSDVFSIGEADLSFPMVDYDGAGLIQDDCPSFIKIESRLPIYDTLDDSELLCKVESAPQDEFPFISNGLEKKKRVKKLSGQPSKNLMAERRRRKRLNDRLTMLRSVVPKISKMDRTSILGDTIDYMRELLERIRGLQEEIQDGGKQMNLLHNSFEKQEPDETLVKNTPRFDVERRNTDTRIEVSCAAKPGMLLSTVMTLEALGLEIQQCVISCFNDFGMQASCSEGKMQGENVSSEDIKKALFRSAGYGGLFT